MRDILCCLDSPLPSIADLWRNQVRFVNFAQKIFNRNDHPILVRKFFTNAFSAPSLLLANEFNRCFILACYLVGRFDYDVTVVVQVRMVTD